MPSGSQNVPVRFDVAIVLLDRLVEMFAEFFFLAAMLVPFMRPEPVAMFDRDPASLFSVASYLAGGLLVRDVFLLALPAGPAYGLGLFVGSHMFGLANDEMFRRICYVLIAIAVLVSLPVLDGVLR